MAHLADLTVVILSFGRQEFLARQLSYWSASDVNLLILDGSQEHLRHGPLSSHVTYVHSPADYFQRMIMATEMVKTRYVALLGDDDLYLPSGLLRCMSHLDSNRTDVGAVGRSLYFFEQAGRVFVSEKNPESSNYPSSVSTGIDRLHHYYHSGKIGSIAYGVYRSPEWKNAIRATYGARYSCAYVYDTFLRTMLTYAGNISVIDAVTWMCSGENPPILNESSFNRKLDLIDWLTDGEWSSERIRFRDALVFALVKIGPDAQLELESATDEILRVLADRYSAKLIAHGSFSAQAKRLALRVTPSSFKQLAKRFLSKDLKEKFGWKGSAISEIVGALKERGIFSDPAEMQSFERFVQEFHKARNLV